MAKHANGRSAKLVAGVIVPVLLLVGLSPWVGAHALQRTDTETVSPSSPANNIGYNPVTPADWAIVPREVGSALDIAQAVVAANRSFFNGTFLESFDALVTSDGATVMMSIEQTGGGDLTMRFSDGRTTLVCTPSPATIPLDAGADDSPTDNFIYILQSTKALTKATSDWPSVEHIKVGFFLVPSAGFVQAKGVYINHNTNDHAQGTDGQGHLVHITERLRADHAIYRSGAALTVTIGGGGTTVDVAVTAGVVRQMHKHATPAMNTATGDAILILNQNGAAFDPVTDLETLTNDANGVAVKKYFNWLIAAVANKGGEYSPLILNLPTGSYNKQQSAETDVNGYDVFRLPSDYDIESATGFLIARVTMSKIGGTWAHVSTVDLRGTNPQSAIGGVGGITTEFADNAFKVFDESDNTKELAFQLSGITTGNTRTITMADADVDLGKMVTAAAGLTANALVVGDGARGLSSTGITHSAGALYDVGGFRSSTGASDPSLLAFVGAGSTAVNYWQLSNHITNNAPIWKAAGSDAHIGCDYWTKGTNKSHTFKDGGGLEMLTVSGVATAVNEVTVSNAATGAATDGPSIAATGGDTNISLKLVSKGTGIIQADGVGVVTAAASSGAANTVQVSAGADRTIRDAAGVSVFGHAALAAHVGLQFKNADGGTGLLTWWNSATTARFLFSDPVQLSGNIVDTAANEIIKPVGVGSAVNEVTITNAATTNDPSITASGETNVGIIIASKGTGVVSIPGVGTGGYTEYDLKVGDVTTPDYGMIQLGNFAFGRTSYISGSIDLDGAVLFRNIGGPVTSEIEFLWAESTGDTCRFALPKSGVGNATYNPRSMLIAGPAPANTDFVKVSYWQTQGIFHNLTCDTTNFGADLGVQYNCEIENNLYVNTIIESTTAAGVTIEGVLAIDNVLKLPEVAAAIADTAGYGQFWVKDDAPSTPWFTDDEGNDVQLGTPGGAHDMLSATHTDSVADAVTRGSLIFGNATPKWDELPIGAAATFLYSDGTDAIWKSLSIVDDSTPTLGGDLDVSTNYLDWGEIAAPANPAANVARMYCKDDAGTTKLFFRDSAGTETEMGGGGGGAPHAILDGSTHSDSVADAVTRGSLIYGNSTPKWDELVIGAGATYLRSDGTDAAWTALAIEDDPSPTLAAALDGNGQTIADVVSLDLTSFMRVDTDQSNAAGVFRSAHNTDDTKSGTFSFQRSEGTRAVPTAVSSGVFLGSIKFAGHDGTNFLERASIRGMCTGAVSAGNIPTAIEVRTGTATPSLRWTTQADGETLVEGAGKWMFGDSGQYIHRSAANTLRLSATDTLTVSSGATVNIDPLTTLYLRVGGGIEATITSGTLKLATNNHLDADTAYDLTIGGVHKVSLNANGVGFNGAAGVAAADYTVVNHVAERTINVTTISDADLRRVVGTIITDLQANGLFQ